MTMLDTFNSDSFNVVSLTTALDMMPYQPNWLGRLGIFTRRGITTTTAIVENREGRLALVPQSARGTTTHTTNRPNRKTRSFQVPHFALTADILADDVQGVRAFGSENEVETLAGKVNEVAVDLRNDIEVTKEYQRYGAIQGIVYDQTGSVIYNYFTEFETSEQTQDFVFSVATTDIKAACASVIRKIHSALGADMVTGVVGLCGDNWWDAMVGHAKVLAAYDRWNDGLYLRTSQMGPEFFVGPDGQSGFNFGGITFFNSRASLGGTAWINTDQCRFFPLGVRDLFQEVNAPADYEETVNTMGMEYYAKQERMPFDRGIQLEVQSNPLIIATRPRCLIKGTKS